jgi:transcription antitermination protein NusB
MQNLFSYSFSDKGLESDLSEIIAKLEPIDTMIAKAAPEWPIDKIAKIDLAMLRLSVFELAVEKKEPPKVIIDEAVELAKEFGNQNSPQFVNGVLGTILKEIEAQNATL